MIETFHPNELKWDFMRNTLKSNIKKAPFVLEGAIFMLKEVALMSSFAMNRFFSYVRVNVNNFRFEFFCIASDPLSYFFDFWHLNHFFT